MDAITQHYIVDFSSNNNFVQIPAVQGDGNNSRFVEIEMVENGTQYVVDPSQSYVTIIGTKPDGNEIWNNCDITPEGYILVEITYQMTAVVGRSDYQIMLFSKTRNDTLKSFPFILLVTAATFDPSFIISSNEFEALNQYTTSAQIAAAAAADSATAAATSETNAAASEANAATSATNAATSATNAATSETNAAASAAAAATSESNAATSAANAATSEANAATSEANAATSEANAANSAEDAESWADGERSGTPVPSSDPAYHNNAKYWALQAAGTVSGVATFNTRSGFVLPQAGDYDATLIDFDNTKTGLNATTTQDAIDEATPWEGTTAQWNALSPTVQKTHRYAIILDD